jgi:hypothetical protein
MTWKSMATSRVILTSLAAAAAALVAGTIPANAAPPSDGQGYLDSTARCGSVADTAVFGSTSASRVAICETADGLQYRGVRVRDGARLVLPATASSGGAYVANNDGITYTVTSEALVVGSGSRTIREETMLDFHGTTAPSETSPSETSPSEASPSETSSTTAPVPDGPPLPAEVGGSGS